jgi:MerR family transcriptional regulator, heat shock protein HspR
MDAYDITPRYTMSVAARLVGIPAYTLRSYEREGLVTPGRLGKRNRLYSDTDIARARHIAELSRQGINLAGIKAILVLEEQRMEQQQNM